MKVANSQCIRRLSLRTLRAYGWFGRHCAGDGHSLLLPAGELIGKVVELFQNLLTLKDEALTIFRRRKIGFVFQSYNLVPVLSVWENIILPVQLDGRKVDMSYVEELISTLGLEKKLHNLPNQLSRRKMVKASSFSVRRF